LGRGGVGHEIAVDVVGRHGAPRKDARGRPPEGGEVKTQHHDGGQDGRRHVGGQNGHGLDGGDFRIEDLGRHARQGRQNHDGDEPEGDVQDSLSPFLHRLARHHDLQSRLGHEGVDYEGKEPHEHRGRVGRGQDLKIPRLQFQDVFPPGHLHTQARGRQEGQQLAHHEDLPVVGNGMHSSQGRVGKKGNHGKENRRPDGPSQDGREEGRSSNHGTHRKDGEIHGDDDSRKQPQKRGSKAPSDEVGQGDHGQPAKGSSRDEQDQKKHGHAGDSEPGRRDAVLVRQLHDPGDGIPAPEGKKRKEDAPRIEAAPSHGHVFVAFDSPLGEDSHPGQDQDSRRKKRDLDGLIGHCRVPLPFSFRPQTSPGTLPGSEGTPLPTAAECVGRSAKPTHRSHNGA